MGRLLERYDAMQRRPLGTNTALSDGSQYGAGGAAGSQYRKQGQAYGQALRILSRQARRGDARSALAAIDTRRDAMNEGFSPGGITNRAQANAGIMGRVNATRQGAVDMEQAAGINRQPRTESAAPAAGSSRILSRATNYDASKEAMGSPEEQARVQQMVSEGQGYATAGRGNDIGDRAALASVAGQKAQQAADVVSARRAQIEAQRSRLRMVGSTSSNLGRSETPRRGPTMEQRNWSGVQNGEVGDLQEGDFINNDLTTATPVPASTPVSTPSRILSRPTLAGPPARPPVVGPPAQPGLVGPYVPQTDVTGAPKAKAVGMIDGRPASEVLAEMRTTAGAPKAKAINPVDAYEAEVAAYQEGLSGGKDDGSAIKRADGIYTKASDLDKAKITAASLRRNSKILSRSR